jgi:hypothetical protein
MRQIILLILLPFSVFGQIDYKRNQFDRITSKDSVIRIDWTLSSSKKTPLYFDHVVRFTNEIGDDIIGSEVYVDLFHNDDLVRIYKFKTADHIDNFITLDKPIKLKEGDKVYFIFRLISISNNESYIFNIEPILIMHKDKLNRELEKKSIVITEFKKKEVKHKSKKVSYRVKKNQKIGTEINGIIMNY